MIRALRVRHRWMIAWLAIATLAVFLAALAARPEPAIQERLPPESAAPARGAEP